MNKQLTQLSIEEIANEVIEISKRTRYPDDEFYLLYLAQQLKNKEKESKAQLP